MLKILKSPLFWIFFLAIGLRLVLTIVNRDANDNHAEVIIRMILGMPVGNTACFECYQPKFWYSFNAIIDQILIIRNSDGVIVVSQIINFLAGTLTLIFIWKFIKAITSSKRIQYLTFALVALNPDLIAINGQGTNDTFVILFGVGAIYFLWKYLKTHLLGYAYLLALFVGLSTISKGSGLVVGIVVLFCLFVYLFVSNKQVKHTSYALLLSCGVSIIAFFFLTPYYHYLQTYGRVDVINMTRSPQPNFFKNTVAKRPGITSIASGYFTFQFIDLLKNPYVMNNNKYTVSRTSLWSQLYGRAFSSHFPNYPPTWADTSATVMMLTRLVFILGLIPLTVFMIGFVRSFIICFKGKLTENLSWVFVVAWIAFVGMIILYTYNYRDYSFMKTIFLYPALLSIGYFLTVGLEFVKTAMKSKVLLLKVGFGILIFFITLEILDIILLIGHL